jgi:hypothetical protein
MWQEKIEEAGKGESVKHLKHQDKEKKTPV